MKCEDDFASADTGSLEPQSVVKEEDILGETLLIRMPAWTPAQEDTSHVSPGCSTFHPQPPLFMPTPQPGEKAIKKEEPEDAEDITEGAVHSITAIVKEENTRAAKLEELVDDSYGGMEDDDSWVTNEAHDEKAGPSKEDEEEVDAEVDGDPSTQKALGKTGDYRACKLCNEEAREPNKHVLRKHLDQPVFLCPLCPASSNHSTSKITLHIKSMHPKAVGIVPINNREKLETEIQRLQMECFPSRRVKSSVSLSNARQKCKMCNNEVPFSRRQCHVYTNHLRGLALFTCPLCDFSSSCLLSKVMEHIKWDHKTEYGKVKPISHEKKHEKSILAMNEQCFPGWKRKFLGRVQTRPGKSLTGGSAEVEMEGDYVDAGEAEGGSDSECGGAVDEKKKNSEWTPIAMIPSKRMKTIAEVKVKMEEENGGGSGSGLAFL